MSDYLYKCVLTLVITFFAILLFLIYMSSISVDSRTVSTLAIKSDETNVNSSSELNSSSNTDVIYDKIPYNYGINKKNQSEITSESLKQFRENISVLKSLDTVDDKSLPQISSLPFVFRSFILRKNPQTTQYKQMRTEVDHKNQQGHSVLKYSTEKNQLENNFETKRSDSAKRISASRNARSNKVGGYVSIFRPKLHQKPTKTIGNQLKTSPLSLSKFTANKNNNNQYKSISSQIQTSYNYNSENLDLIELYESRRPIFKHNYDHHHGNRYLPPYFH